jgi:hypothetical protein
MENWKSRVKKNPELPPILEQYADTIFDIVIPFGPNDVDKLKKMVEYTKKNVIGYRNIYIVSYDKNVNIDCTVIDENIFPFNINTIDEYLVKRRRNGWYLQQLLKLYSGFVIEGILDNYLVIDCDTFFLKPTTFFENGVPLYNFGTEYHVLYFEHMEKMHPTLIKQNEMSGICHHLLFQKKVVAEMFELIENYHNKEFYKVFLESIDFNNIANSGASEYELYFNYMQIYHKNEFKIRELKWMNSGYLIENQDYDYISCHWHMQKPPTTPNTNKFIMRNMIIH